MPSCTSVPTSQTCSHREHADVGEPGADLPLPVLVVRVARALARTIEGLDPCPTRTVFDGHAIPKIPLERYIQRLQRFWLCSGSALICALVLLDRFLLRRAHQGLEPQRLTERNVHRIFITCLVIVLKFNEDVINGNLYYALYAGINVRELNELESTLLLQLDFNVRVEPGEYKLYESGLRTLGAPSAPAHKAGASAWPQGISPQRWLSAHRIWKAWWSRAYDPD